MAVHDAVEERSRVAERGSENTMCPLEPSGLMMLLIAGRRPGEGGLGEITKGVGGGGGGGRGGEETGNGEEGGNLGGREGGGKGEERGGEGEGGFG